MLFTCKIRLRYSRERACQSLEVIQFIYTFNSLDVPELRIRELVDLPIRPDGEVTPHARVRLEPHALDLAARGAEAVIRVLGRDARRADVRPMFFLTPS